MNQSINQPIKSTHVVLGVDQEVEGARLVNQGQERNTACDLPDHALDLFRDGLLRLARLLLLADVAEAVVIAVVVVERPEFFMWMHVHVRSSSSSSSEEGKKGKKSNFINLQILRA